MDGTDWYNPDYHSFKPYDADRITRSLIIGGHFHDPSDGPHEPDPQVDKVEPHGEAMLLALKAAGVTHVLNVAAEYHNEREPVEDVGLRYFKVPLHDDNIEAGETLPIPAIAFLAPLAWVLRELRSRTPDVDPPLVLYVHCHSGHHRAPLISNFLLCCLTGMTPDEAHDRIIGGRPTAVGIATPIYRRSLVRALALLQPILSRYSLDLGIIVRLVLRLAEQKLPKDSGLEHPIDHLDELADPLPVVPKEESPFFPEQVRAIPGTTAQDEEVYDLVHARQVTPVEQQLLTRAIFAGMYQTFLARWRELQMGGVALPRDALDRLRLEAESAAHSFVRTHNRALLRFAGDTITRYVAAHDGARIGLRDALTSALTAWVAKRQGTKPDDVAGYQLRLSLSLADLFAGGPGSMFTLSGPALTAQSCTLCQTYYGQTVPAAVAWQNLMPAHPDCEHTWEQVSAPS